MNQQSAPLTRAGVLLVGRVIIGAMALGVLIFAVVVIATRGEERPLLVWECDAVTAVLLCASGIAICASFVAPSIVGRKAISRLPADPPEKDLLSAYQSKTIVGPALLEGGAFTGIMSVLLGGCGWGLVAGLAAIVLMLARCFPTASSLDTFLESSRRWLRDREGLANLRRP